MAAQNGSTRSRKGNGTIPRGRRKHQEPRTPIERFINILSAMLVTKQMPQRELAERLGVTIGTLTKYLRGEVFPNNVKTHISEKLASLRGVSLDSLLHYYDTGEFDKTQAKTSIEDVVAWVESDAGQEDLISVMEQATAAQKRMLALHLESVKSLEPAAMWGDEGAKAYGNGLHESFMRICEEKGLSDWDGWAELLTTPAMQNKPDTYLKAAQSIISGREVLSGELMTAVMNEYGDCPARMALEEWGERELPELKKLSLDAIES